MGAGFLNIDWKSEPPLREKVMFAIVPLLLLVPCVRLLWLPMEGTINKLKADHKMIETQAATIKKMLDLTSKDVEAAAATVSSGEMKTTSRAFRILRRQLADRNTEVAAAVSVISSRQMASGIQIRNIAVGKEVTFPNYTAVPVDVILEGGYSAVGRYLKALEEIERPVLVRGIRIVKTKGEGGALDARLTLWVYLAGGGAKK